MRSSEFIQGKLQAWAERKGVRLQGSAGDRGAPNYTFSPEQNVFEGTFLPSVRRAFDSGAGRELRGDIPSMSALHSSAALAVNLFQYWKGRGDLTTLARLLDVPSRNIESGEFEDRFPVCEAPENKGFKEPPHLDFAIRYADGARVGVECKLFEPYGRLDHTPLRKAYLDLSEAWSDLPACRALAEQLAAGPAGFHRLGASQLLKHLLGLKFQASTGNVQLLYLYYDAIGDEAAEHRQELRRFQAQIASDPIRFVPISVQEFVIRAVRLAREGHPAYVDYIAERYL